MSFDFGDGNPFVYTKQDPNIVMSNPYTLPPVDNRPQYLKDRDREDAIASAKDDEELNKKIVEDAQKETQQEDFDRDPINYEGNKLISEGLNKFGKL
jgi:hypothetical protein